MKRIKKFMATSMAVVMLLSGGAVAQATSTSVERNRASATSTASGSWRATNTRINNRVASTANASARAQFRGTGVIAIWNNDTAVATARSGASSTVRSATSFSAGNGRQWRVSVWTVFIGLGSFASATGTITSRTP